MKVDFSHVFTDFRGKPLSEGNGPSMTLAMAAELALVAMTPQSQQETGEQKYRNWKLATNVYAGGVQEITPEEATLLKTKIGEFFGAQIAGPAFELLNG